MKIISTFTLTLVAMFASASFAQSVGGHGSGGGGLSRYVRPGCTEGSHGSVTVTGDNGDPREEFRTCHNGTFMTPEEKAAYVYHPHSRCAEGSVGSMTLMDNNGHSYTERRICHDGTYMTDEEKAAYVRQ